MARIPDGFAREGAAPRGLGRHRLVALLVGTTAALVAICDAGPIRAEPAACALLREDARTDCLIAAAAPRPGDGDLKRDGLGAPVTAPLSTDAFRLMAADALVSDPAAYLHQPVAVASARCFSFGVGNDRCVLGGATPVVIATAIVIPPEAEVAVEQGCGGLNAGSPPGCSGRIMFVPSSHANMEVDSRTMLLLRTENVMMTLREDDRQKRPAQ